MDDAVRERLRRRFARRCGYCGVHEDHTGATLTCDHHRPRFRGGGDQEENLVYACARCNQHKGSYWHEQDPPHIRLLLPGRDDLPAHLSVHDDGHVTGTTREGAFFLQRLELNRPQLVAYRSGLAAREKLSEELASAHERVRALERRMSALSTTIDSLADDIEGD